MEEAPGAVPAPGTLVIDCRDDDTLGKLEERRGAAPDEAQHFHLVVLCEVSGNVERRANRPAHAPCVHQEDRHPARMSAGRRAPPQDRARDR
jgi:hypothetical protein